MTRELKILLKKIQTVCDHDFNCVLLNLYRNGSDSNGWHADNEKELGINPKIASFSFGETRFFHFKHRQIKTEKYKNGTPQWRAYYSWKENAIKLATSNP